MTAFKAKVREVYPDAWCSKRISKTSEYGWAVAHDLRRGGFCSKLGEGKTAFAAWDDAWQNIEAKNS